MDCPTKVSSIFLPPKLSDAGGLRMALTYSRDGASRPLAILCSVLREIRHGVYKPDETRSGRLVSELDVTGKTDLSKQRVREVALEETEPAKLCPEVAPLPDPPAEGEAETGHVTTDSSSDSEPETVVKPARYAHPFLCPKGTTGWIHRSSSLRFLILNLHPICTCSC